MHHMHTEYTMTSINKKFELIKDEPLLDTYGRVFYRIRALRDIGSDVAAGDLGGYVESEINLCSEGECWIYDDARVLDFARVFGNAQVRGNVWVKDYARVFDNAIVGDVACVSEEAYVFGNAKVWGKPWISGNAQIFNNAILHGDDEMRVYGRARVYQNASLLDSVKLYGRAEVTGNAVLSENAGAYENAKISGNARMSGHATVKGDAHLHQNAQMSGQAVICDEADVGGEARLTCDALVFGKAKIRGDALLLKKTCAVSLIDTYGLSDSHHELVTYCRAAGNSNAIIVVAGDYTGTDAEFLTLIQNMHGKDSKTYGVFAEAIEQARSIIQPDVSIEDMAQNIAPVDRQARMRF